MSIVLGKKARVLIGATPTAVGHVIGKIDYSVTDTAVETTASDSTSRTYVALDLKSATLSFEAQFDIADAGQDLLRTAGAIGASALVPITLYAEGATVGNPKWTGSMVLEEITPVSADTEGVSVMACKFKGAPLTEGVI